MKCACGCGRKIKPVWIKVQKKYFSKTCRDKMLKRRYRAKARDDGGGI
jgi:hypothetical protein